ncbi:MAG TPA: adenylate/guanylate cyclase domain-containing protein [Nitrospiraceae bacterium]
MAEERVQRRLAAILVADVVGFSRLTEIDEEGTLIRLKRLRAELMDPMIAEHRGRTVKLIGDGALVEFMSAVDAVRCAILVQRGIAERNATLPAEHRLEFRIGINLGDMVIDGDDILGDGVNIAARLEGLAEPGCVCISGNVQEQIAGKLDLDCRDMGERRVKNIARPLRAYHVNVHGVAVRDSGATVNRPSEPKTSRKPTIAVLPFDNMSGDPEQDYFADGITEDIITELSRFRSLVVIARNSTFIYKGRSVNVGQVGRELGANYVLEGSVRRRGNHLRVSAQLVEARVGNHLWADRYDGRLEDVFSLQDEVTQKIVSTLAIHLEDAERVRSIRSDPENLSAYECCLRGKCLFYKGSKDELLQARLLFEKAIELDPGYAAAYVELGETYFVEAMSAWTPSREAATEKVQELARTAMRLDPHESRAHLALAWAHYAINSDFDLAVTQIDEALRLNPNDFDNYCFKGWLSTCLGELEEAVACSNEAFRRSPHVPDDCLMARIAAEYLSGNYYDAVMAFDRMLWPNANACAWVSAAYAQLGRPEEAGEKLEDFYQKTSTVVGDPASNNRERWLEYWAAAFPSIDAAARDRLYDGLRKAGLPL